MVGKDCMVYPDTALTTETVFLPLKKAIAQIARAPTRVGLLIT